MHERLYNSVYCVISVLPRLLLLITLLCMLLLEVPCCCCCRVVSDLAALVSDDVCERRTHAYSSAAVGSVLLRRIHHFLSGHARHAENEGLFALSVTVRP